MSDAVLVAVTRTPFARSGSGAFNLSHGASLGAAAVQAVVERSGVPPDAIEDVLVGCAQPEGATGANIARQIALAAGLPLHAGGLVVSRGAASGLEAIALAAQRIAAGGAGVLLAGGVESPSCVRREANTHLLREPDLARRHPALYRPAAQAAAQILGEHGFEPGVLERYAAASRRRALAARQAGRFAQDLVPVTAVGGVIEPGGLPGTREFQVAEDELWQPGAAGPGVGGWPALADAGAQAADAAIEAGLVAAPADGAAAGLLASADSAERLGLRPWARLLGFATAAAGPQETGLAPAFALQRLLQRLGLGIGDIDLWELHEASAAQVLLCAAELELPAERLNVDGGALALGEAEGASGLRLVGHALAEAGRRGLRRVAVAIDAGAEVGVAGVFELC